MIIDSLSNSAFYEQLNPYFKEAFDYLKSLNLSKTVPGKVVLKEDALIVNVNQSQLKTPEEAKLETHEKFIDIQLPLSVPETFGWKAGSACKQTEAPYDPEKDIEFFADIPSTYFTLHPGEFAIFFPDDAHAPCVGTGNVTKIIVKVKVI